MKLTQKCNIILRVYNRDILHLKKIIIFIILYIIVYFQKLINEHLEAYFRIADSVCGLTFCIATGFHGHYVNYWSNLPINLFNTTHIFTFFI